MGHFNYSRLHSYSEPATYRRWLCGALLPIVLIAIVLVAWRYGFIDRAAETLVDTDPVVLPPAPTPVPGLPASESFEQLVNGLRWYVNGLERQR